MAPILNKRYTQADNQPLPDFLREGGPFLQVLVHVPSALAALLSSQNQVVPPPQPGLALIDTGASGTCVHEPILTGLGLSPIGSTTSGTAAGPTQHDLYAVRLEFNADGIDREFNSVAAVDLSGQFVNLNTGNQPIVALIGRDVMQDWLLVYNGPLGVITIAH